MRLGQVVMAWGMVAACAGSVAQAARLADGTAIHVRLRADLVSAQATVGGRVDLEIAQPVLSPGGVAIPQGAVVWGAVQEVKKGKSLRFDVEGLRLSNQQIIKLRCSPQKTTNAGKDEIKVETQAGGDLGAAKGTEFTVYLDQDVNVEVAAAPPAPSQPPPVAVPAAPQPAAPPPAPVATPTPAAVVPAAPKPVTPPTPPTPVAAPPVVSAPVAPPVAPVTHSAPTAQPGEYITVECFSDPLGADIMIDDEFHGSTPSILKLLPGNHRLEFRLMGYKARSQALNLRPGDPLTTVRISLDKQP